MMGVSTAAAVIGAAVLGTAASASAAQKQAAAQKKAARRQAEAVRAQTERMKKIEAARQTAAQNVETGAEDRAEVEIGADEENLLKKRNKRRSRIDLKQQTGGGASTGLQL